MNVITIKCWHVLLKGKVTSSFSPVNHCIFLYMYLVLIFKDNSSAMILTSTQYLSFNIYGSKLQWINIYPPTYTISNGIHQLHFFAWCCTFTSHMDCIQYSYYKQLWCSRLAVQNCSIVYKGTLCIHICYRGQVYTELDNNTWIFIQARSRQVYNVRRPLFPC